MQFDRTKFAGEVGSSFVLKTVDGQSIVVKLVEVTGARERPRQLTFSMLFKLPENCSLEQGLYDLQHESLGELQLFLVPIGRDTNGTTMEAVINTIRDDESGSPA